MYRSLKYQTNKQTDSGKHTQLNAGNHITSKCAQLQPKHIQLDQITVYLYSILLAVVSLILPDSGHPALIFISCYRVHSKQY